MQEFLRPLAGLASNISSITEELRVSGSPEECVLIAADPELDGATMPLRDAVEAASSSFEAVFVSCVPGRLGYFDGPGIKNYAIVQAN
ncbi:MAG: hypothetical protein ABJP82_11470 [Hyphomicrobiales bacterium]